MFSKHERVVIMALTLAGASLVALGYGLTDALLTKYHGKAQQRAKSYQTCLNENMGDYIADSKVETVDQFCRILTGYEGE